MGNILEFAGYVLGATVLFGVVIAFFLLRAYWYQPRAVVPHPAHLKLPTEALNAMRQALEGVKRKHAAAAGAEQEELSRELRRLDHRLDKLEQKTFNEQQDYHYAIKRREGAWLQWKKLYDRAAMLGKQLSPQMRDLLKEAEKNYVESHRAVELERHTAVARDMVNLEELRGQEVLTQTSMEQVDEGAPLAQQGANPPEQEVLTQASLEQIGEAAPTAQQGAEPPQPELPPQARVEERGGAAPLAQQGAKPTEPKVRAVTAPENSGLRQAHFKQPSLAKAGKRYADPAFELVEIGGLLRNEDLSGSDFEGVEFRGTHVYHNCNFSHANLGMIRMERQDRPHQFSGCDFSGAHFTGSRIAYAVFSRCDLSRTHWAGAELNHVKFVECAMEDVFWEQVDLSLTAMAPDFAAQMDFSEASAPPRLPSHPVEEKIHEGNSGPADGAVQPPKDDKLPTAQLDTHAPQVED